MKYRMDLPQLGSEMFLADGGLETTLVFHEGRELPLFAAVVLLEEEDGTAALRRYYEPYVELARERGTGIVLDTPTWRAGPRWAGDLGYPVERFMELNRVGVELVEGIRESYETDGTPIVINGAIGPQDDGYNPSQSMSAGEAREYHSAQVETFADTVADMVSAITMTYSDEAIGITRAAQAAGIPVVISFTVETDGNLPSGESLGDAITAVDEATDNGPAYFMINCAHPTHFENVLAEAGDWRERIRGLRANASKMSHEELDQVEELDAGDPADLGARYDTLRADLPNLRVVGGCCGTDHRHVRAIAEAST
jgi:S-methylmethionine-dependent homocysteine/selenocysteine methylase